MLNAKLESTGSELAAELTRRLGEHLQQAFFHGPCCEPAVPARAPLEFSVIVAALELPKLVPALNPVVKRWGRRGVIHRFVLTPEYIQNARDVFPIEFLDYRSRRHTFFGKDQLAKLVLRPAHLRLQAERELRGLILHLRSAFCRLPWKRSAVDRLSDEACWTLVPILRALLVLKARHPSGPRAKLFEACAQAYKLPDFTGVLGSSASEWPLRPALLLASLDGLLARVDGSRR